MSPGLLILIACFLSFHSSAQELWRNFYDTSISFTAHYPAKWTNKISDPNNVFFTSPPGKGNDIFAENIFIFIKEDDQFSELKISEATSEIIEKLKPGIPDIQKESDRLFKWNQSDAYEITYTGHPASAPGNHIRWVQWFCFYNNKLYSALYTATAGDRKYDETAKKIMNSILFK